MVNIKSLAVLSSLGIGQEGLQTRNRRSLEGSNFIPFEGVHRDFSFIPYGPPSDLYVEHLHSGDNLTSSLSLDSRQPYRINVHNMTLHSLLRYANEENKWFTLWRNQAIAFRRFLLQHDLNDVDNLKCVFSNLLSCNDTHPPPLEDDHEGENVCCRPGRDRPMVDIGVVIPVADFKVRQLWYAFESLRQSTLFPKEVIIVLSGISGYYEKFAVVLASLLTDFYRSDFPPDMSIKFVTTDSLYLAGENRWIGFKYTTASLVFFFDSDDYLHPQALQIMWKLFVSHPETEHMMFGYAPMPIEANKTQESCSPTAILERVKKLLEKDKYTDEDVHLLDSKISEKEFQSERAAMPHWSEGWYLGNTDVEPFVNRDLPNQQWWHHRCHNGWIVIQPHVMKILKSPFDAFGYEDSLFNFRSIKAGFNVACLSSMDLGAYLWTNCPAERFLGKSSSK